MNTRARHTTWGTMLNISLLFWFAAVPLMIMLCTGIAMRNEPLFSWLAPVTLLLVAGALLLPLLLMALLTRAHPGWQRAATLATALLTITGYFLLDATLRALLPDRPSRLGLMRLLILLPYLTLAAIGAPRLARRPARSLFEWVGLGHLDSVTLLLALALAALLTLAWPITGALGDRVISAGLIFQNLAAFLPLTLLIWGLVFNLLTSTLTHRWQAALITMLLYVTYVLHGLLPQADLTALLRASGAFPLAFLLTELRARTKNALPALLVGVCYLSAPRLFTDPRDVARGGVPEIPHMSSATILWLLLCIVGLGLWISRWFFNTQRDTLHIPALVWKVATSMLASSLCVLWLGVYVFIGHPGFYDDGFLIILEEQATFPDTLAQLDREARLSTVYDMLVATAERTQAPLRAELERRDLDYRPYYLINMIRVEGHHRQMRHFETWPGVAQVILNPNVRNYPLRSRVSRHATSSATPVGLQSNLAAIQVDAAWDLGITGESIVVAGQDSGYEWTHPVLLTHYRGWNGQTADHNYNWHDAWDDISVPHDDDGHGTHTMGTIVGDDGATNHTGVAPGAQWIGCRNMRHGLGNPGAYVACMEYFLAPYPYNGDPFTEGDVTQAPHVINNSWGCPPEEGCAADTLEVALEALRAAGIMMVVSAGNDGPDCASAVTPPANYDAAYSVGATHNSGNVTGFSSRGPVGELLKPDIAAPGSNVRSSFLDGEYGLASGTSMAGPHVTGLVALLWSANPALIGDIDATEILICRTATPHPITRTCESESSVCTCGDVVGTPNNVYGCGVIDVEAAVKAALEKRGE